MTKSHSTTQTTPRTLILSGYGINCEDETARAFNRAGAQADIVHINDLIAQPTRLNDYQILAIPGGFSFGDDLGSGKAFAAKVNNHLQDKMREFATDDKLIIGICNGFQILVALGLTPALDGKYGERQVALLHNESARYIDRWVDVECSGSSPWVQNLGTISVPIAHGEGKFYANPATLQTLNQKGLIAARYVTGQACEYQNLAANPNGTLENIAGITDESGRIFGLMPHPERAQDFTQLPWWPLYKRQHKGETLPCEGPGLGLFRNAVNYFK